MLGLPLNVAATMGSKDQHGADFFNGEDTLIISHISGVWKYDKCH